MIEGRWVDDNERILWLSTFGTRYAIDWRNPGGAAAIADGAVEALRGMEPEITVVEMDGDAYRDMLRGIAAERVNEMRVRAATYRDRTGCMLEKIQADSTIERTFFQLKAHAEATG